MSRLTKFAAAAAAAALLCLSPGAISVAAEDDGQIYHDAMFRHWGLDPAAFPVGSYSTEVTAPEPAAPAPAPDLGAQRNDIGPAPAPVDVGRALHDVGDHGLVPDTPAAPVDTRMDPDEIVGWAALGVAAASAGIAGILFIRRRHEADHLPHAA